MALAKEVAAVLKRELKCYIAWPPIGTEIGLGDYGVLDGGVFNKNGNIGEFPVPFRTEAGQPVSLDFTSADTTVVRVAAGAEVTVLPQGAIDASIKVKFNAANALMLKAPNMTVQSIANLGQVAKALKAGGQLSGSSVVVGTVYQAKAPLLLATIAAGTEVTVTGDTGALQALQLGQVSADIGCTSSKELGLRVVGPSGVLGFRLFKLSFWSDDPKHLGPGAGSGTSQEQRSPYEWME